MPDENMGEGSVSSEEPVQGVSEVNWDDKKTVSGLEHLGRAIVDENGQPSGSPANFEHTRGITGVTNLPDPEVIVAAINSEFAAQQAAIDEGS